MQDKLRIQYKYTWEQVQELAKGLGLGIANDLAMSDLGRLKGQNQKWLLFGVPRGGVNVVHLIVAALPNMFSYANDCYEAHAIVDDIIDSGATRTLMAAKVPLTRFYALVDKTNDDLLGKWVVFPWESDEQEGAENNVRRLLQAVGEDPNREGLRDTPKRYIKALREYTSGYDIDPADILKVSFDIADADPELTYDQIIMSGPLPYNSMCEHHLAPFEGHAWIAYLPAKDGKIAGLSKLARVLDAYAKRLQVQERLTVQIANAIEKHLEPRGVAVLIRGRHLCQCHRGVKKDGRMITSVVRGVFNEQSARNEFLEMVKLSSI
jgi:GTP cyclohydrolase I